MSERSELRSRREERMEMALKIRLGARPFPKTFSNHGTGNASVAIKTLTTSSGLVNNQIAFIGFYRENS
jgi:hypothetical protein